ncbi:MAG: hypothetical protein ACOCXJ_07845 [Planctomycetota bacterium]
MDIAIDTRRIPPRIGLHRTATRLLRRHLRGIHELISHGSLAVVPQRRHDGRIWSRCILRLQLHDGKRLVVTGDDRPVVPAMRHAARRAAKAVAPPLHAA